MSDPAGTSRPASGLIEQARAEGLGCARGKSAQPDSLQTAPPIRLLQLALPMALRHGLQIGPLSKPEMLQERGSQERTSLPLAYMWADSHLSWLQSEK